MADATLSFLTIWGEVGVNCFVLMSGYFFFSSRFKMRSLLRIILETVFYSYIIQIICCTLSSNEPYKYLVRSILPISGGNYWFITAYVGMYSVLPILNWCGNRFEKATFIKVLIIQAVLLSVIPTITTREFVYSSFAWFSFVYMLGGYISKFPDGLSSTNATILAISCLGFIILSELLILLFVNQFSFIDSWYIIYFTRVNMVPEIGLALGIFIITKNHPIKYSPVINNLAKTALSSYLITDNPYVRDWLWPRFSFCYDMGWLTVLSVGIITGVVLYIACALIDFLRLATLEKWMFEIVDNSELLMKIIYRIDSFMAIDAGEQRSHYES